jgi:hypothetical protein
MFLFGVLAANIKDHILEPSYPLVQVLEYNGEQWSDVLLRGAGSQR